jgi:hypothetical protein
VHDIANVLKKTSIKQYPFAPIRRFRFALARFVGRVDLQADSKILLPQPSDRSVESRNEHCHAGVVVTANDVFH